MKEYPDFSEQELLGNLAAFEADAATLRAGRTIYVPARTRVRLYSGHHAIAFAEAQIQALRAELHKRAEGAAGNEPHTGGSSVRSQ